eukprot:7151266-Karenia_brevis.AAC.1
MLEEKCHEWCIDLWIATLDFKKAFDCVEHTPMWDALVCQRVPRGYVQLLASLYHEQTACVKTDRMSR